MKPHRPVVATSGSRAVPVSCTECRACQRQGGRNSALQGTARRHRGRIQARRKGVRATLRSHALRGRPRGTTAHRVERVATTGNRTRRSPPPCRSAGQPATAEGQTGEGGGERRPRPRRRPRQRSVIRCGADAASGCAEGYKAYRRGRGSARLGKRAPPPRRRLPARPTKKSAERAQQRALAAQQAARRGQRRGEARRRTGTAPGRSGRAARACRTAKCTARRERQVGGCRCPTRRRPARPCVEGPTSCRRRLLQARAVATALRCASRPGSGCRRRHGRAAGPC